MPNPFQASGRWYCGNLPMQGGAARSTRPWNDLICRTEQWWGVACDDAHARSADHGRAWLNVRVPHLTPRAILDAIRADNFWSSTGPRIEDFTLHRDRLTVWGSPCGQVRVVVDGCTYSVPAPPDDQITGITFGLGEPWHWLRVERFDAEGGATWSKRRFCPQPSTGEWAVVA